MTMLLFGRDRVGFIPMECWRGGEDGDGGDLTGAATARRESFLADYTGSGGENLREQAVTFVTPEDLCAAMEVVDRMGLDEEGLDQLLAEEAPIPARSHTRRNRTKRPPEVRVNGQPLGDYLAGKPNTAPIVLRGQAVGQRRGGKRRRRRGRRGNGNGHSGNGRR